MSLYRKYRPQTFAHLVGQDHVSQTLLSALKLGRVSHAYLFTGPRGTGKTSSARLVAKALNCLDESSVEPCNKCEICTEIAEGRLIDIIEIDAASNRGIDEMRDLREKINFAPTRAKVKVYIIDEVHMLTKEAFNALLKTLEEPPEHVYFVLATTEVHKIPETILSRCQRFDFQRIPVKVLVDRLSFIAKEEKIEVEEKALEMIAHHAEGGLRDAIGLLEQMAADGSLTVERVSSVLGIGGFESLEQLYDFLEKNDAGAALKEIDELYMKGHDLAYFNKRFLEFLREKMIDSVMGKNTTLTNRILEYIDAFQKASERARLSSIPQLPLEMAAVSCCVGTAQKVVAVKDQSSPKPVPDESPAPPTMKQERVHKSIPVSDSPPKAKVELPGPESSEDSAEKKSLELDAIKQQWSRILETIKSPIARRSVQQAQPFKTDGVSLILAFSTNFHMEKVMTQQHRNDIEHAIHEVTGVNMKLAGEIHEIQRPPAKKESREIT
ncbi:MAG TPA: DNA polymerase III subunit gamma/tau, partial [Candidatus Gracilibacteria bacterium]|nr:DNA polymerase III subunit gamma/tau [Candidatus Gracilibacteria bacterium]